VNLTPASMREKNQSDVSKNQNLLTVGDILYYQDAENLEQWQITGIYDGLIDIKNLDNLEELQTIEGLPIENMDHFWSIKAKSAANKAQMLFRNDDNPNYPKWITLADYEEMRG
jgi:hypothetical protein